MIWAPGCWTEAVKRCALRVAGAKEPHLNWCDADLLFCSSTLAGAASREVCCPDVLTVLTAFNTISPKPEAPPPVVRRSL